MIMHLIMYTHFSQLNLECKRNMYGVNCTGSCGHCQNSTCHHVNGTCLTGCSPGYQGPFCSKGKTFEQNVIICREMCRVLQLNTNRT